MQRLNKNMKRLCFITVFSTVVSALVFSGCSKSSSGGGGGASAASTSVVLSGALSIDGASTSSVSPMSYGLKMLGSKFSPMGKESAFSASYALACSTFELPPVACGTDIPTSGVINITCENYAGKPFGCFVYNKSTYQNYSIVFNVKGDDSNTLTSTAGEVSLNVNIDTVTGVATADTTLPTATETGTTSTTFTLADLAMIDGTYKMAPAAWSSVSSLYTTPEQALLLSPVKFWSQGSCPTGTTAVSGNMGRCEFTPSTAEQGFNGHNSMGDMDANTITSILNNTYAPMPVSNSPMTVFFKGMTEGSTPVFTVWSSETAYNTCVDSNGAYTFKISDGTTNIPIDLPGQVAASTDETVADNLLNYMNITVGTAINSFAPVLNILDMGTTVSTSGATVTCVYPYDLDWRANNMEPAQVTACEADTSSGGCASLKNDYDQDYRNALWRYKSKKIYDGANASSDAMFTSGLTMFCANQPCDFNFSDNIATGSVTVGTAIMTGWTQNGPELTDTTAASEIELGGCLVWSKTPGEKPKIVKEGEFFSRDNGITEKCTWNERRLVVVGNANDYMYQVDGEYYKDATYYITVSSVKKQIWSKLCQISLNSQTWIENAPASRTEAQILSDVQDRAGGRGNQQDRNGMKFRIMYNWLASKDGPGSNSVDSNSNFRYGNGMNDTYSCQTLTSGTFPSFNSTTTWDNIGNIVKNSGDWDLGKFMACFLVGLANDPGTGQYKQMLDAWSPSGGDTAIKTALAGIINNAAYKDTGAGGAVAGNNIPDKIDKLSSYSCMPRVDISRVCNSSGCGDPKVICTTGSQANGGCDKPAPSSRMAKMDVTALGGGLYSFFNFEEHFRYEFDPKTNSGKVCTETNFMTILNKDPVSSTVAAGTTLLLQFNENSASVCDGEESSSDPAPKKYMNFLKQ